MEALQQYSVQEIHFTAKLLFFKKKLFFHEGHRDIGRGEAGFPEEA